MQCDSHRDARIQPACEPEPAGRANVYGLSEEALVSPKRLSAATCLRAATLSASLGAATLPASLRVSGPAAPVRFAHSEAADTGELL